MQLKKRTQIARQPEVIRTAMRFAFIVGPVLIIINYGDKILVGDMQQLDWLKCLVTLIVPYTVSTLSSVSAYIACQDENDET